MKKKRFQLNTAVVNRYLQIEEFNNSPEKKECIEFGMKTGCEESCPVYEAEKCPNQLNNELFFKWMNQNKL